MITRCKPLLGTFVEITVPANCARAADTAFSVIAHVHERMSFHEPGSDLAKLRNASPGEAVLCDRDTIAVLRVAIDLWNASDGLFDVTTARSLVRAGFLPRSGIGHLARYRGTTADIEVLSDRHVRLKRRVLIDLGGIAKGYAVDRAVEALKAAGAPEGLVNAGGDLRAFGKRAWQIALRDADHIVRSEVSACNCAMASSANLSDRRQYRGSEQSPHIGRGGAPMLSSKRVTVVADRCIIADAMTKVAMADLPLAESVLQLYGGYILSQASETYN